LSDSTSDRPALHKPRDPSEDLSRATCNLCGLPIGYFGLTKVVNGETLRFCCQGCLAVFDILFNRPEGLPVDFRQTDLYRTCVEFRIIPKKGDGQDFLDAESRKSSSLSLQQIDTNLAQDLTFRVGGMWCTACAWLLEEILKKSRGILDVRVHFLSDLIHVKYLPQVLTPQEIEEKVSKLGYSPSHFRDDSTSSRDRKDLLLRLGISSFLTANIMMISFCLYTGFFENLTQSAIQYLSYPIGFLATLVILYGGFPILRRAALGLRSGGPSVDTLIAMGFLSAYGYSMVQLFRGGLHLYFDTASMLITLVLLGRFIENRSREKVSRAVVELYSIAQQKVRLHTPDKERWVTPEALRSGDQFLVLCGERVPLDGRIVAGWAHVDESILTGESRPKRKGEMDEIMGGTLLLEGKLRIRATQPEKKSSLSQMVELIQEALEKKNPFEQLADHLMRWLIPFIILLAIGTSLYLLSSGATLEVALLRAVTVLVITCPCALGIASPLAKVAAIGKARTQGILVRDSNAFQRVKDLDTIVFDKTGTLTQGKYRLQKVVHREITLEATLQKLASVEIHSDHYLAREILRRAKESTSQIDRASDFKSFEGLGVAGRVNGEEVFIGNRTLLRNQEITLSHEFRQEARTHEQKGRTVVFYGWKKKTQGLLVFGDSLKEGALATIQQLREKGFDLRLVSGDSPETTRAIAEELNIEQFRGQALPQDKVEIIRSLQEKGKRVGMVGDGLNDAPSLAQADVGLALGATGNLTQEASDITLLSEDPVKVLEAIRISNLAQRIIRQNLFFAFCYNGLAIPLAIAGELNPLIAVFAMFASSLSVIGNTLRITKA
jgi:heavy metal translocating P-type ATPase